MSQTPKGYASIVEELNHNLKAGWRTKEELESKLQWVLDRADKYAAFCGVSRDDILTAWESKRDSWWFGYYADHKQPDPNALTGYPVMLYKDWLEMGKGLYGPDMLDWKFRCPVCGHVQALRDFHDAGVDPDYGTANCASRFGLGGDPQCRWTTGGALAVGGRIVINPNYIPQLIFDFADSAEQDRKTLVPGDIVQIRGLEGPLNGKCGEVVKIQNDGKIEVKVATVGLDARNEFKTIVSTIVLAPEQVVFDKEITERLRTGKGGVIYR